jgi:hypothetical protein
MENTQHQWSNPIRYAGSIAEGPPPGVNHRSAVVYECACCHKLKVEAMTEEQAKTMRDGLPNLAYRHIDDYSKCWDGKGACT